MAFFNGPQLAFNALINCSPIAITANQISSTYGIPFASE